MVNKLWLYILFICITLIQNSCVESRVIASADYHKNEKKIDSIHYLYNRLYAKKAFSLEFNNKPFNDLSIAIYTDSIKYIYQFKITEKRMEDTLRKYNVDVAGIKQLVTLMSSVHCTWINNLAYYDNGIEKKLTYISIRSLVATFPFTTSKYFILTYFEQPQYYDTRGRLLTGKEMRKLRQINNETFHRINDSLAYTISEKFR
jgi:hypothetical protein